ncbi:carboxylate-amine ligase [Gryllotalpicola ginsengisoli]|uniref:carboxylate-amine ligase n=1 Tax=Gryllotalpicola ginsengisoli TaxID=444608 RepID=UPI0003FECB3D|nr:glutamate--cysteine ligase [Gryllotalpicola ginsengisoli]
MRKFGVEEELLLVDAGSGHPIAVASALLDRADGAVPPLISPAVELTAELQQEMLEAVSSPQETLDGLRAAIAKGRASSDRVAALMGARAAALATAPLPVQPHLMPHERYLEMTRRYGTVTRDALTMGCHVHVSIDSPEEGVGVLDRIRVWLPLLVAVSANSPFKAGEDTGHASYRTVAWRQWPTSGPLEVLGSAAAYDELLDEMRRTGVLIDDGMVYFDARLSRNHPTVEIRVADICLKQTDAALIAALSRGLVETAAREWAAGEPAPGTRSSTLRLATWKAAIDGVRGELVDPVEGVPRPAAGVLERLLEHVRPALTDYGDEAFAEAELRRVIDEGTGADWQRRTAENTSLGEMVTAAAEVTQQVGSASPGPG